LAPPRQTSEEDLGEWFSGANDVVVAGIGNPIREDDFAGVAVSRGLHGKVSERVLVLECETVPENFAEEIIEFKPSHVLLVDAAFLGLRPGEFRLVKPEELTVFPAYSSHMLPLRIFCDHIEQMTKARIALLLIEPESVEFGEGLTPSVRSSTKKIAKLLIRLFPK
jgi:hydrogenase 3 maturation protease